MSTVVIGVWLQLRPEPFHLNPKEREMTSAAEGAIGEAKAAVMAVESADHHGQG